MLPKRHSPSFKSLSREWTSPFLFTAFSCSVEERTSLSRRLLIVVLVVVFVVMGIMIIRMVMGVLVAHLIGADGSTVVGEVAVVIGVIKGVVVVVSVGTNGYAVVHGVGSHAADVSVPAHSDVATTVLPCPRFVSKKLGSILITRRFDGSCVIENRRR